MSRIDDLIAELCPDGVEWKCLWEVTYWDKRFNAVDNYKQEKVLSYPYLLASDLFALEREEGGEVFLLSTGEQTGWTNENEAGSFLCEGEVVAIPWGKSRPVKDVMKYYKGKFVTADNRIATSKDKDVLLNKYLFYFLHSQGDIIDTFYRGSGIKHPSMKDVLDIRIPIPPHQIQEEIVRILDAFTKLEAELEAELEARKKQYAHYCRFIISNNDNVSYVPLSKLGKWFGGGTPSMYNREYWSKGTIPWVSSKDMTGSVLVDTQDHITPEAVKESSTKLLPPDTVAIVARSGILKHTLPIVLIPFQVAINQDIKALIPNKDISSRYVAYTLRAYHDDLLLHTKKAGGTVDSLDMRKFLNFPIPLPPITEQARIVEILDRFDALTNDITHGLPAEVAARRKQYEYYRDKLLSFKEKVS